MLYKGYSPTLRRAIFLTLCSRSLLDQQSIFDSPEAQSIMVAMEDETSSLFCVADNRSMMSKQTQASESSATLDLSFDFDAEILGSKIYAVTYRSHLRQAIASGRQGKLTSSQAVNELQSPQAVYELADVRAILESWANPDDSSSTSTVRSSSVLEVNHQIENRGEVIEERRPEGSTSLTINAAEREQTVRFTDKTAGSIHPSSKTRDREKPSPTDPESPLLSKRLGKENRSSPWSALIERLPRRNRGASVTDTKNSMMRSPAAELTPPPDVKILLLGTSESGKSTLLKGMKLFYEGPYTEDESRSFSKIIFSNVCQSVRAVLEAMESLEMPLGSTDSEYHVQTIFMQPTQIEGDSMPLEIGMAIEVLARDEGIQAGLERRREYQLNDNIDL